MAKVSKEGLSLILLFLFILAIRIAVSSQTTTLDSEAYFLLRQAENIRETGFPIFQDTLSYSGRTFIFQPLFSYAIAALSFIFSMEMSAKLASDICLALCAILIYFISRQLTKNKPVSFIAAIFAGFTPAFFIQASNPGPSSLGLFLMLSLAYAFLNLEDEDMALVAVVLAGLSLLNSSHILLFISAALIYFVMTFLEKTKRSRKESELTTFLFFLAIWFNVLLYKKAFLNNGASTLWGNVPSGLLSTYFQDASFLGILSSAGIIPLFLGIYAIYNLVFESKSKQAQLFIGFAIASFLALWLKIIPLDEGLLFFSTSMIILSAHTMKLALVAAQKTKFSWLSRALGASIIVLFLALSIPFMWSANLSEPQGEADLLALNWMKENTLPQAVILSSIDEGFLVNYKAERKNVADANFQFITDPSQHYNDIKQLYSLKLTSEAVRLMNKYEANYVFLSTRSIEQYQIPPYLSDEDCFKKVYSAGAEIYEFKGCKI